MNKLIGLLAATALCSLFGAAPASAGQEIQELQRVQCLAKTNPYTGGTIVAAKVHYIMGTIPNKKNNLRKLSFEVRLVPAGAAGIHWNRTWRKYELDKVSADGANRKHGLHHQLRERARGSWDIQVKSPGTGAAKTTGKSTTSTTSTCSSANRSANASAGAGRVTCGRRFSQQPA